MRLVISLLAMGLLSSGVYAEDSKVSEGALKVDDAVAKIEAAMKASKAAADEKIKSAKGIVEAAKDESAVSDATAKVGTTDVDAAEVKLDTTEVKAKVEDLVDGAKETLSDTKTEDAAEKVEVAIDKTDTEQSAEKTEAKPPETNVDEMAKKSETTDEEKSVESATEASDTDDTKQADQAKKPTEDSASTKTESEKTATSDVTVIEATTIALRGKPHYPPEFTNFDYVNADAPIGGSINDWAMGTFDNFNPYSQRGDAAKGSGNLNDDIMASSDDDLSAYYPLIAEKISYNSDFSAITFHLDKRARFHDGVRIKPSDIKFSFEKLTEEGLPGLKAYYSFVDTIELVDDYTVKFNLKTKDKARMMALCGFTVFPEHFWKDRKLNEPLKVPPVGSSAYKISDYKFGKYVTYQRVADYWAKDLPAMKGLSNEGETKYDYYRDETVAFEAFKAGHIDKWVENTAKRWSTGYEFPAVKDGRVKKEGIKHNIPLRAQGFVFNIKKPQFSDLRVRKAMTYLMDFEWMNKNLFYGQYQRVTSYFMNTAYMAEGLPSEAELKVLEPIKDQIPASVFTDALELPTTKGTGNIRGNLRQALRLFKQAGWTVKNQKLINNETGKQFEFELLLVSATMEKVALPFRNNLERAGIKMDIRTVDSSQYMNRRTEHDYDMIVSGYGPFPYPSSGMDQQFHSDSVNSSYNPANLTDKAVDYLMVEMLKVQEDEEKLLPLGKAIDRVLMHSYLMIPQWNISKYRVAHWDKFGKPEKSPNYSLGDAAWWIDKDKAAVLDAK